MRLLRLKDQLTVELSRMEAEQLVRALRAFEADHSEERDFSDEAKFSKTLRVTLENAIPGTKYTPLTYNSQGPHRAPSHRPKPQLIQE